ncbi:hypothetical protein [Spirochaeta cellobiosiphila]|uniref:hypothetical protein n=1 Tax=Spirochaeta cellobiosiphila TaxID=504483 RepID=UPI0003FDE8A7|nr:hypothetical protein [Spirochaeta cellobiosiphila]
MKQKILVLSFIITSTLSVSEISALNTQELIPNNSKVYDLMDYLFLSTGRTLTLVAKPVTIQELLTQLEKIDVIGLNVNQNEAYKKINSLIYKQPRFTIADGLNLDFSGLIAMEGYYHTNTNINEFSYSYADRLPFFGLYNDFLIGESAYVGVDAVFKNDRTVTEYYDSNYSNLPYNLWIDLEFLQRSVFSWGGNNWNVTAGRDLLDWGTGLTGNFLISDATEYHEFIRLKSQWKPVTFSFMWMSINPVVYDSNGKASSYEDLLSYYSTPNGDGTYKGNNGYDEWDEDVLGFDLYKALYAHRADIQITNNLLFSISESAIQANQYPQLGDLNPFMVFHSSFMDRFLKYANILAVAELNYTPIPGIMFYGHLSSDQWSTTEEQKKWPDANEPNAIAYLAGIRGTIDGGSHGYFTWGAEYTHTDPYFYLEKYPLLSYTYTKTIVSLYKSKVTEVDSLGHWIGNDSNLFTLMGTWYSNKDQSISMIYTLLFNGELQLTDLLEYSNEAVGKTTPTGTDEVMNRIQFRYNNKLTDNLGFIFDTAFYHFQNYENTHDNTQLDYQIAASISYSF